MYLTAILSTLSYSYLYLHNHFYSIVPKGLSVQLGNGFIYSGKIKGKPFWGISDQGGRPVVSHVTALKTYGKIVYGQRDLGIAGREYTYFLCSYGEDCAKTQSYGDVELNKELEKIGQPPFDPNFAETRKDILIKEWLRRYITLQWHTEDRVGE